MSLEQAMQARDQWREGKLDVTFAGTSWIALFPQFVNPSPPMLADARSRRALLHATDRQRLVDVLLAGLTPIAHSYVGPTQPEYKEVESSIVRYEYDLRRAAQLIEELGYTKGPDDFYRDGASQKLSIEIRTTAGDDLRDKLLFSVADDWQRAGIGVETLIIPRQRSDDREYRSTRPAFELVRQPNDLSESALVRLHSSEAALPENGFRRSNRTRYMSPELDALIVRYLVTIPLRERLDLVRQIVHHISDQLPVMGLLYDVSPMLISNRLQHVTAEQDTRNAHEWDWR
jgi:peptide/nickel transport system substrate-binding protein